MDPLSITAGVIAVLQAAVVVLQVHYRILSAVKKAPRPVIQVIEEVQDLHAITQAIQSRLANCDDHGDEIARDFCRAINEPLARVASELSALGSLLQRVPVEDLESRWKLLKHAFFWALEEQEAKDCLARLERCKNSLKLAIASQNW